VLGVGLSFNYDHMKPLQVGQPLSMRRMHSRAAKSAIRRANELTNPESLRKSLANINHQDKQTILSEELKREAEFEVQYLANRLADLLPPVSDFKEDEEHLLQVGQLQDVYVKRSTNEYVLQRKPTTLIEDLLTLSSYDLGGNPTGVLADEGDDEFLEAWKQQYAGGYSLRRDTNTSTTCLA
jgi:hypothetical protein